jgi:hypothetical protein
MGGTTSAASLIAADIGNWRSGVPSDGDHGAGVMNKYEIRFEPTPSEKNPLVVLTDKIEELIAQEPVGLAISALVTATMRLEMVQRDGNQRAAAERLARAFADIARKSAN